MDKTLILTVGLPRSGKSTWAREQGHPIVSPDAVRLAVHGLRHCPEAEPLVWMTARYMVKSLFLAGHATVILDATNLIAHHRNEWRSTEWQTVVHVVDTDDAVCKQRAIETGQADLVPVIERMDREASTYDNVLDILTEWVHV